MKALLAGGLMLLTFAASAVAADWEEARYVVASVEQVPASSPEIPGSALLTLRISRYTLPGWPEHTAVTLWWEDENRNTLRHYQFEIEPADFVVDPKFKSATVRLWDGSTVMFIVTGDYRHEQRNDETLADGELSRGNLRQDNWEARVVGTLNGANLDLRSAPGDVNEVVNGFQIAITRITGRTLTLQRPVKR